MSSFSSLPLASKYSLSESSCIAMLSSGQNDASSMSGAVKLGGNEVELLAGIEYLFIGGAGTLSLYNNNNNNKNNNNNNNNNKNKNKNKVNHGYLIKNDNERILIYMFLVV